MCQPNPVTTASHRVYLYPVSLDRNAAWIVCVEGQPDENGQVPLVETGSIPGALVSCIFGTEALAAMEQARGLVMLTQNTTVGGPLPETLRPGLAEIVPPLLYSVAVAGMDAPQPELNEAERAFAAAPGWGGYSRVRGNGRNGRH